MCHFRFVGSGSANIGSIYNTLQQNTYTHNLFQVKMRMARTQKNTTSDPFFTEIISYPKDTAGKVEDSLAYDASNNKPIPCNSACVKATLPLMRRLRRAELNFSIIHRRFVPQTKVETVWLKIQYLTATNLSLASSHDKSTMLGKKRLDD